MKSRSITDMPEGCSLIQAKLIRVGDRVRFRMPSADYTVEAVETDKIGHVRHRANGGTAVCSYHPGELLWIERRSTDAISEYYSDRANGCHAAKAP